MDDPYDPVIAAAVAAQPRGPTPVRRTIAAIRAAWAGLPAPDGESVLAAVAAALFAWADHDGLDLPEAIAVALHTLEALDG